MERSALSDTLKKVEKNTCALFSICYPDDMTSKRNSVMGESTASRSKYSIRQIGRGWYGFCGKNKVADFSTSEVDARHWLQKKNDAVVLFVPPGDYGCHGRVESVNQTCANVVASALCQFTVDAQISAIFPHNNRHAARRVLQALADAGYKVTRRSK